MTKYIMMIIGIQGYTEFEVELTLREFELVQSLCDKSKKAAIDLRMPILDIEPDFSQGGK